MKLKVKQLHKSAILPSYATHGAACFDLHALFSLNVPSHVRPGYPITFNTGLMFEVPPGWVMMIYSRSGHGFKNNVRLSNCVGVIDSDYRGEVMVKLTADELGLLQVSHGDRIAQAMLVPVERVQFELVEDLSATTRGAGGFGSTGN